MRNPPLLLIVDDDKDFQEVLVTKFKASGFEIVSAYDGEEGLEKTKELLPDLVLMDVKMPKMSGVDAMTKIKEDPATKNIKVILLTAFGDPQPEIYGVDKKLAVQLGADEYFLKTQDLDEMVSKAKDFVQRNQ